MKTIKNKFDKHDIADLPKVTFEGRIITVVSEGEAQRAVAYLLSQPILGFDTETKPSFRPGAGMHKVALLQVSTPDTCFLFRLNQMGFPDCIRQLLEDTKVTKVGLSWHDDLMQLHRRAEFTAGTFVELQHFVRILGIEDLSLQKIYANLFGQKISKSQRLTNWEADVLSQGQKVYAATDAWACIQIFREIVRLRDSQDYELEIIPEPVPVVPVLSDEKKEQETAKPKRKPRSHNKKDSSTAKDGVRKRNRTRKKSSSSAKATSTTKENNKQAESASVDNNTAK